MIDWRALKARTQARIGLDRRGHAQSTKDHLAFQAAHATARDAVWAPWDVAALRAQLDAHGLPHQTVATRVTDRRAYLLQPSAGRRLRDPSELTRAESPGVALLVSDGLSAHALHAQGHALVVALAQALRREESHLGPLAPIVLAPFGRVALSDEVGDRLGARLVLHVLGERPGLSAVDSMAIYLTHGPRLGNTDADRNCISNIREPHGLPHQAAIAKALYLARETLRLGYGGYRVKDTSDTPELPPGGAPPVLTSSE